LFEFKIKNNWDFQSFIRPFCVQAKVTKFIGLKNKGGLSPINLVTFAWTQNGELEHAIIFY
jgi:hypothetical protein